MPSARFCAKAECPNRTTRIFCRSHRCKSRDCLREIHENGYCFQHLPCEFPGCGHTWNPLQLSPRSCQDHACNEAGCNEVSTGPNSFCNTHLKCHYGDEADSCRFDRAWNRETNTLKAFCAQHLQCSNPGCSRQKRNDSDSCDRHTCQERDCGASLASPESPGHCPLHRCTIETVEQNSACKFPKARKQFGNTLKELQYCLIHNCKFEGPRGPCEEKSDGRVYCVTHRCSSPGCDHIKLMDHDTTHTTRPIQFCNCHSLQVQPIQEEKEKPVQPPIHIQEETQELGPERGIGRRFWPGRS